MILLYSWLQASQRSSETISHRPQNRTDRHQYPNNWLERVRQKTSAWNCQGSEGTVTKQRQNTQRQVPTNLWRTTRRFWSGKWNFSAAFKVWVQKKSHSDFHAQISTQALVPLRNDNWLVEANFPRGKDQSEALFRSGKWQVISMEFLQPSSFRGKRVAASWDVGCFPRLASDVFMHCLLSKKSCSPRHYCEHQGFTLIAALSQGYVFKFTLWQLCVVTAVNSI